MAGPNGLKTKIYSSSASVTNTDAVDATGLAFGWSFQFLITDVDPNTSTAWTTSAIDSCEVGVTINGVGQGAKVAALYLSVEADAPSDNEVYNETATGGARPGSTAVPTYRAFITTSGGVVIAGTTPVTTQPAGLIATGGIRGGGLGLVRALYYQTWSGGVVCAGTAINNGDLKVARGGAVVGGTANNTVIPANSGTGGLVAGSSGLTVYQSFITTTGGVVGAGTSQVVKTYEFSTNGGLRVPGGSFSNDFGNDFDIATTAVLRVTYNPLRSGGARTGGSANVDAFYRITALGSARPGGLATATVRYAIPTSGGARISGISLISFDLFGFGGIRAGGDASSAVIILGTGGAVTGGSGRIVVNYTNVLSGSGVVCDGRARIARRYSFSPVKTGIGRTLASDNILKPKLPAPLLIQPYGSNAGLAPTGVRTQASAEWNEITESSENVLIPVTIRRQRPYLPPKRRGTVARNNQFATVS